MAPVVDENNVLSTVKRPRFYTGQQVCKKLLTTWQELGYIILGVEYEDVICNTSEDPYLVLEPMHELLRTACDYGARIVIITQRERRQHPDIMAYCKTIDLPVRGINTYVGEPLIHRAYNGQTPYDLLVDWKAGIQQAWLILKNVVDTLTYIGENANKPRPDDAPIDEQPF